MLFWADAEFAVERVMPHLLHIIPVYDNTMFDGLFDLQNAAFALRLLTDVNLTLVEANHNAWDFWAAHHGAEDSARSIISGETSLAGS